MALQTVFKRYELKYMLTIEQKQKILEAMKPYMELDKYGRTTIRNLYFDTDTYLLIRRSIEKPEYKEKLRIRSYDTVSRDGLVFVELKKKYHSVVYKRRVLQPYQDAMSWLDGEKSSCGETQISKEIEYCLKHYGTLHPTLFLSYEREAFYAKNGSDFRVTFDDNILVRTDDLSLESKPYGTPILQEGLVLMEIKCSGGIPLWMAHVLSQEKIYKTSFSKYGTAYRDLIFPKLNLKTMNLKTNERNKGDD